MNTHTEEKISMEAAYCLKREIFRISWYQLFMFGAVLYKPDVQFI